MTRQTKRPNRVEQVENPLDRVERMLEQLAERQIHADNRLDRFERALIASAQATQKSIETTQKNIDQLSAKIDRLSTQTGILLQVVQGHISQSTPPAHSSD
ncbi:MAG: hypothetical protein OXF50_24480 [Caldilineaceae bacterium]|nr:hypothetical protein [Caldilineaceae bacterium]